MNSKEEQKNSKKNKKSGQKRKKDSQNVSSNSDSQNKTKVHVQDYEVITEDPHLDDCTKVAFTARKLIPETLREPNVKVTFENVTLNVGDGYNSSTGIFTAPADGIYVFSWSIATKQFIATGSGLYVNGIYEIARAWADAREVKNYQDDSSSATVAVQLHSQLKGEECFGKQNQSGSLCQ
ncbi:hypothetical protein KUTeg_010432 [Tegillarca granosa]|uniref:C1q domain-containing protein n=1 Tax=Tegillarca granosa TaxID=220873 RepID=A0ABQ9F6Q1_TEGGR|nr:hypothetical protein KUTeg_010432 [Tegillarca granosa]